MWCPAAAAAAALLALLLLPGDAASASAPDRQAPRAERLTTFGKTPTAEAEPKIPKGKECRGDEDCQALEFTTCKVDSDRRKRCLCHDLQPPVNGECATKRRDEGGLFWPVEPKEVNSTTKPPLLFQPYVGSFIELHQACHYDHECIQGAECVVNGTIKANEKRCYCRFGYVEEDNECNSAPALNALVSLVVFTTLVLVTHTN